MVRPGRVQATISDGGLLALDFDGTIVARNGEVSQRTAQALAHLAGQGWHVVGATGRPASLCGRVVDQVSAMGYLVASNGAEVYRIGETEPLFSSEIAADDARSAMAAVRNRWPDAGFCLGLLDGTQQWERGFELVVPVAPLGEEVDDAVAALAGPVRTVLIFGEFIAHLGTEVSGIVDQLVGSAVSNLGVADSGLGIPEIRPRYLSKAFALEQLRQELHIDATKTIAFGDGINDHEMLRWAHRGVAMGDADAATLRVADEVTGPIGVDGVAVWLEQHIVGA